MKRIADKNQKSLTVENLNINLFFQDEFINEHEKGVPFHKQLHNHSYVEIFACLSGNITIETLNGVKYDLYSGDVAIVPSAVEHIKAPESSIDTKWVGFGFVFREVQNEGENDIYSFFDGLMGHKYVLVYKNVSALCKLINDCHENRYENEVSTLLSLVAELIKLPKAETLLNDDTISNAQKSKNIERLLLLDDIVNTKFHENYSNKDIASLLYVSERHLSRIVSENYSEPLRTIILKKRLDVASELLVTTKDGIEVIAQSVGFKNKNSFYREFKKRFGKTPKEYRKI